MPRSRQLDSASSDATACAATDGMSALRLRAASRASRLNCSTRSSGPPILREAVTGMYAMDSRAQRSAEGSASAGVDFATPHPFPIRRSRI
jgi:hypothetical protein